MYRATERTQKRKDKKRQLFLDTAARVFAEKGYYNTTVKDIVNNASASVGSFYSYFDSKEDLFIELYRSIVKQFNDITASVLDITNYTLLKNFTRVMTATLWMYEQKREIARIILLEAAAANPAFQKIESDRMLESARTMAEWFTRFRLHNEVKIPDERLAALMYSGTYYYLINDWLSSDASVSLTKHSYAFCVFNLQALGIRFDDNDIKTYIDEVLAELTARSSENKVQRNEEGESNG